VIGRQDRFAADTVRPWGERLFIVCALLVKLALVYLIFG
jgi:hypothetical protein